MNVVAKRILADFWTTHADAKGPVSAWYQEVSKAHWHSPQDIKRQYRSVDFLEHNRVVFDIKGNTYRIIGSVAYAQQAVFIKFVGTHAEYSKIDAKKVTL
ncbi:MULTISPECIES: type II toxin-antitoxin system HigB family toxin [Tatumella]|uniref:mRNA interferase HigB n=1 Tax=Tatumella ptyseos TaxID=82987 RepID=A0A2X5P955_9GAMM|nr:MULTISPECIES: type II toxin-antitoxin system HigB family toxin [Tatumella]SQK74793.1 mRNA interferase HigB [Tatumella ptyseos]